MNINLSRNTIEAIGDPNDHPIAEAVDEWLASRSRARRGRSNHSIFHAPSAVVSNPELFASDSIEVNLYLILRFAKINAVTIRLVKDYWNAHYVNESVGAGVCGLCGNSGVIDTRGRAVTATGIDAGGAHYCICPNGQERRAKEKACGSTLPS